MARRRQGRAFWAKLIVQAEYFPECARPSLGEEERPRTADKTSIGTLRDEPARRRDGSQPEASLARTQATAGAKRRQRRCGPRDRASKGQLGAGIFAMGGRIWVKGEADAGNEG
jgi:hypothetical protein